MNERGGYAVRKYAGGVYVALVSLAWLVNYPGRLTTDSVDQITQSEHLQVLNDWHSPVTTWLWSVPASLLGQPAAALFVQIALIFSYPALLCARVLPGTGDRRKDAACRIALYAMSTILLSALIFAAGQIVKDLLLVGLMSLLLACLDLHRSRGKRSFLWLAVIAAAFVVLVRPPNFFLVFVAGVSILLVAFRPGRQRAVMAILTLAVVCGLSFPATKFVSLVLLGAKPAKVEISLLTFDGAGISVLSGDNRFLDLADWPVTTLPPPQDCYTPERWDDFRWGKCGRYFPVLSDRADAFGTSYLFLWWTRSIVRHPLSYLMHRARYAAFLLFSNNMSGGDFAVNSAETIQLLRGGPVGGAATLTEGIDMSSSLQLWKSRIAIRPFEWVAYRLVSHGGVSCLALIVCVYTLAWCYRRPTGDGIDIGVVASAALGLANFVMYLPFGSADDGRYLQPTLFCGGLAVVGLMQSRLMSKAPLLPAGRCRPEAARET